METETYTRKPLNVEAVRVSDENMQEVAEWCDGRIREANDEPKFIQVKVARPMNVKQTRAFVGDWVLKAGRGFKVYTDSAFNKYFVKANDGDIHLDVDPVKNIKYIDMTSERR